MKARLRGWLRDRSGNIYILMALWILITLPILVGTMLEFPSMVHTSMQARQAARFVARSVAFSCYNTRGFSTDTQGKEAWKHGLAQKCRNNESPSATANTMYRAYLSHLPVEGIAITIDGHSAAGTGTQKCTQLLGHITKSSKTKCYRVETSGAVQYNGYMPMWEALAKVQFSDVEGAAEAVLHWQSPVLTP